MAVKLVKIWTDYNGWVTLSVEPNYDAAFEKAKSTLNRFDHCICIEDGDTGVQDWHSDGCEAKARNQMVIKIVTGLSKMHRIVEVATDDIKRRLWTLYWLVRMIKNGVIVELGVRRGDSTRALLAACEDCGAQLMSFDIENVGQHVKDVTAEYGIPWFNTDWVFFCMDSVDAGLGQVGLVSMVFLDTDHTYETTKKELTVWSPHVVRGGCIVFHDYFLPDKPRDGVKPAVDEFVSANPDKWSLEVHEAYKDPGLAIAWRN